MKKRTPTTIAGAIIAGSVLLGAASFAMPPAGDSEPAHRGEPHKHKSEQRHKRHSPQRKLEKMLQRVNASESQKQVIQAIIAAEKPQMQALKARQKALRADIESLDPMSGDYNARVNSLADQQADLARDRMLQKAALRQQIALQLTAEQRSQIKAMQTERAERRAAMKTMTKEERREARKAWRAQQ